MNLEKNITIVGNVFVDIKGGAFRPVHKDAKNVGRVQIVHGGVGRNVAHNLAVLGANVRFVSSVTEGGLGEEVLSVLQHVGVDTACMKTYPENGMGVWLAVLQPNGELVASISEQPKQRYQEETIFSALDAIVRDSAVVGLDVGISEAVNERVAAACRTADVPVLGVVGNLDAIERKPESLANFDVFVCNRDEAEILAGFSIASPQQAFVATETICGFGCQACIITLADEGCVVRASGMTTHIPAEAVALVDSTGAGDSFFAGVIFSVARGHGLEAAASFGSRVAGSVVASSFNTLQNNLALID